MLSCEQRFFSPNVKKKSGFIIISMDCVMRFNEASDQVNSLLMSYSLPVFLDFEASSLSYNSHPIEVAWSNEQGQLQSYLIKPEDEWTDWDSFAEQAIHHISRVQLHKEGHSAEFVTAKMRQQLSGQTVYTADPAFDRMWCEKLFDYQGDSNALPFKIAGFGEALQQHFVVRDIPDETQIIAIQTEIRNAICSRHRAAADVQYLRDVYKALIDLSPIVRC